MNYSVDISNVDKAKLLSALYNNARPIEPIGKYATYLMTVAEAGELIEASGLLPVDDGYMYFGKIKDRILNVYLGDDILDAEAYEIVNKIRVGAIVIDLQMKRVEYQRETYIPALGKQPQDKPQMAPAYHPKSDAEKVRELEWKTGDKNTMHASIAAFLRGGNKDNRSR